MHLRPSWVHHWPTVHSVSVRMYLKCVMELALTYVSTRAHSTEGEIIVTPAMRLRVFKWLAVQMHLLSSSERTASHGLACQRYSNEHTHPTVPGHAPLDDYITAASIEVEASMCDSGGRSMELLQPPRPPRLLPFRATSPSPRVDFERNGNCLTQNTSGRPRVKFILVRSSRLSCCRHRSWAKRIFWVKLGLAYFRYSRLWYPSAISPPALSLFG